MPVVAVMGWTGAGLALAGWTLLALARSRGGVPVRRAGRAGPLTVLTAWYGRTRWGQAQARALAAVGWEIPPAVWAGGQLAAAGALAAAVGMLTGLRGLWPLVLGAAGTAAAVRLLLGLRRSAQAARLASQWPEAARALARGVRAGLTVYQALLRAGRELPPPAGPLLARVANDLAVGAPLPAALASLCERAPSARPLAGVLTLHPVLGGNLAAALDRVALVLAARQAAVAEVRALTAEIRATAQVAGLAPLGGLLVLHLALPGMGQVLTRPAAWALLAAYLTVQWVGARVMGRLVQVEP